MLSAGQAASLFVLSLTCAHSERLASRETDSTWVQILSTNDFYQLDAQPLLDNGKVAYAFDGNLLTSSNKHLQKRLTEVVSGLPDTFPDSFNPNHLCAGLANATKMACLEAAPELHTGKVDLRAEDVFSFQSSGPIWEEGHLGCVPSLPKLLGSLGNASARFGGIVDLMMSYEAAEGHFSQGHGGRTFKVMPGDYLGPSVVSMTATKGEHMVEFFNTLGMDYVALGNHEFDCYMGDVDPTLKLQISNFRALTANVAHRGRPLHEKHVADYVVDAVGDYEVCWFGVTSDRDAKAAAVRFKGMEFHDYGQKGLEVMQLLRQKQSCSLVIALTHLDVGQDLDLFRQAAECEREDLCYHLDAMVGAHNHAVSMFNLVNPWTGKTTYAWKMGQNGQFLIEFLFDLSGEEEARVRLVPVLSGACSAAPSSNTWAAKLQTYENMLKRRYQEARIEEYKGKKLGFSYKGRWDTQNVRSFETRSANLLADFFKRAHGGSDVALLFGGNIRGDNFLLMDDELSAYSIRMEFPFNDVFVKFETPLLLLVGAVMEGLQERRNKRDSGQRLILSGLEVVFHAEEDDHLSGLKRWVSDGTHVSRPFIVTPSKKHGLLAMKSLDWHGPLHAAGGHLSTGEAVGKLCKQPPCTLVSGGRLAWNGETSMVVSSNDYMALRAGWGEGRVFRMMGELSRQETHCAHGSPNLTTTVDPQVNFKCSGGLPEDGFYEYMDETLWKVIPEVYSAMQALREGPVFVKPRAGYRHFFLGRPQVDMAQETTAYEGDIIVGALAANDGAKNHKTHANGMADLPAGAGLVRQKMAELRNLPFPRWRSAPVDQALKEESQCQGGDLHVGMCGKVLLGVLEEAGSTKKDRDSNSGDIVQVDPLLQDELQKLEGDAEDQEELLESDAEDLQEE